MADILTFQDSPACSCEECQGYCKRPGWYLPAEAAAAMDAGWGAWLMKDYWSDCEHGNIDVICPANPGHEGKSAPFWPTTGCTFLENGLCKLHDTGHKPFECRVAHHDTDTPGLHEAVAKAWDTDEGRAVVMRWETGSA